MSTAIKFDKFLNNFFKSSLKESDKEWNRIAKMTGANDQIMLEKIRDNFRKGIPSNNHHLMKKNIKHAYHILSNIGGEDLVGNSESLSPGTYWKGIK